MSTVLITGGTGLVGQRLATLLAEKGYTVNALTRNSERVKPPYTQNFLWDVKTNMLDEAAFANCDYIIHLAGEGIADKAWTEKRKQAIIDSRVKSTNLLYNKLKYTPNKVKAFISASATGYYGQVTRDKEFTEEDGPGADFLALCCVEWENAVHEIDTLNIRTVCVRTSVVLSTKGGALEKIVSMAKVAPLTAVGSGNQYMPWIHIDDLCGIFIKAIEDEAMHGPYNAVAPEKQTNTTFTKALATELKKPMLPFAVPTFAIRLLYGEMSVTVLEGSPVLGAKIIGAGYRFKFTNLADTLHDLYLREI